MLKLCVLTFVKENATCPDRWERSKLRLVVILDQIDPFQKIICIILYNATASSNNPQI